MVYNYILLRIAQEEYESCIYWYFERSQNATEQFIEAVDRTLELICDHPDRWRNEYDTYYELGVKGYPYNIVYTIEADKNLVIVHSIYHHSRNPATKYKK